MKKTIITMVILAASSLTSVNASEAVVLSRADNIYAVKFVDEFTGDITSCQMSVGKRGRENATLSIFTNGKSDSLGANAAGRDASGYTFKIDDGEVYQYGEKYPGGETLYTGLPDGTLDLISNGKSIVIRAVPENKYAKTKTSKFSLTGSSVVVSSYNSCAKSLSKT